MILIFQYLAQSFNKRIYFTFSLLLLLMMSACELKEQKRVIKLAHGLDTSHPVHEAMVFMAEELDKVSGGEMTIEIYPSSQLGNEREALELLQIGSLGMTKISAAVMESFSPNFKVLSLPYLFENKAHYRNVLDGEIGNMFLSEGEQYWLKGLCFYDAGSRSFYSTKKPIDKPADLGGMKIRVQDSNTSINMIRSFGGAATPISWGELYTALQQGVVDGAENNSPSFYLSRHYEVCRYFSLNEHTMVPDILMISTFVWDQLSEQEQKWLMTAVNASVPVQQQLWAEAEEEALAAVKAAGVVVNTPDKAPFAELVAPMYEAFRHSDPNLYEIIQQIRSTSSISKAE